MALDLILPRPEAAGRHRHAPGIRVSPQLDLILFSGVSAYPAEIDPWNPGAFRLPSAPKDRGSMAGDNLDRLLAAAGSNWQHIVSNTSYTASGDADRCAIASGPGHPAARMWRCRRSVFPA